MSAWCEQQHSDHESSHEQTDRDEATTMNSDECKQVQHSLVSKRVHKCTCASSRVLCWCCCCWYTFACTGARILTAAAAAASTALTIIIITILSRKANRPNLSGTLSSVRTESPYLCLEIEKTKKVNQSYLVARKEDLCWLGSTW